ncbi:sugar phosphate nucleotidyltransferase [Gracilinema caldarium]|uniref:CBS domain containing protein n=1 Tax=Gracilinema caldarium (strain ATCC 51460 / DSM 7334 / H1) TaxID=744872 RepID=F8F021_GRAC1|nr:sugar phosphate nucleotidyltransferase [Gracilinema caldarium]AEJ18674.1 CBS domain containing protein [Gracilinema caldarium DSM 7334]
MHSLNEKVIIIKESARIKDALKLIDSNSEGLLFVVDNKNKLIGALSDGDIRRALISGKSLVDTIDDIYNKNPFYIFNDEYNEEYVKEVMVKNRYEVVPIINSSFFIEAYVTWDDLLSTDEYKKQWKKLNIPVVIMAGGKGTRMAPFTNVLPKPLIPIGNKTILELIIQEFLKHNILLYYFTINYKGEMIRAYFEGIEKNYEIKYLKEDDFYGTAGSLKLLPSELKGPIIVSNCDIMVKADYADVIKFHTETNASLTILSSIQHHTIPYGVIKYKEGGIVTEIEEKPEYSMCVNTGVYVVNAECLSLIPDKKVFHMTDLIEVLMKNGKKVVAYPINENEFIDIGQWDEYRKVVQKISVDF